MKHQILHKLHQIEREEQVTILYACESGSRAWGFASANSDYDVRFIYVRPLDDYLSLYPKRDVIERPIENDLDINGWDLRKALLLFQKSNPPLLEWLHSPIQYIENEALTSELKKLTEESYSAKASIFHYLHMAKGNFREYLQGEQVRLKKYFYVLRPILACSWIEKYGTIPPVEFQRLKDDLVPVEHVIYPIIQQLLQEKMSGNELDNGNKIPELNIFLEEKINYFEQLAGQMSSQRLATTPSHVDVRLDELFKTTVHRAIQFGIGEK